MSNFWSKCTAGLLTAGVLFWPAGCGGDGDDCTPNQLTDSCCEDSDCGEHGVCIARQCRERCESDENCDAGQRCDTETHVCRSAASSSVTDDDSAGDDDDDDDDNDASTDDDTATDDDDSVDDDDVAADDDDTADDDDDAVADDDTAADDDDTAGDDDTIELAPCNNEYRCLIACRADEGCQLNCLRTIHAGTACGDCMETVNQCQRDAKCGGIYDPCPDGVCFDEMEACFGNLVDPPPDAITSGTPPCDNGELDCFSACDDGDGPCFEGCFNSSTLSCNECAGTLFGCYAECDALTGEELDGCRAGCAGLFATCFAVDPAGFAP